MIKLHDIAVLVAPSSCKQKWEQVMLWLLQHLPGFTVHNIQLEEMKARAGMESLCSLLQAALIMCVCF